MSPKALTLSPGDIAHLENALRVAVSPLDFPSVERWGAAIMESWRPVLTADQAFFAHSLEGTVVVQGDGAHTEKAGREYAEHFWQVDPGVTETRKRLGLEVYHRDDVYDRSLLTRAELFVDWCAPNQLNDILALNVELGSPFPAALHFYHDHEDRNPFGNRGLQLLRLLLPAFKAGIQTHIRLSEHRAQLERVLDVTRDGLALFDADGRPLHRNPALEKTLQGDPERERLVHALSMAALHAAAFGGGATGKARIASSLQAAAAPLYRELCTAAGRYRLAVTRLGPIAGSLGSSGAPLILVSLVDADRKAPADAELRARFGLTKREVEVARLLASGLRTRPLATALGISAHTARRHTERILRKLGLESRAGVAEALRRE
jgi:DNA-binding CsgD family transcriptional regulator